MLEKDLRYPARRTKAQQDAEAMQKVVAEEVDKANQFLQAQGVRVKLLKNANSIQLTATLPVRLGDVPTSQKGTKQYRISHLKCFANLDGIKKAIKEAVHLDDLVKSGKFSWTEYLPKEHEKTSSPKTWRELIQSYEEHYWVTHARNRKSLNTWDKSYADLFKKLDWEASISSDSILNAVKKTNASTVTRHHLIRVLKAICKFANFKYDFSPYSCSQSKINRKERIIPTDDQIVKAWETMPDDATKWTFGMVATYGLRPEEIFINLNLKEYISTTNIISIFHVDKACKTGERKVLPLRPEWVELFDLKNPKVLQTSAKKLETIISWVNKKFRKSPYWKMGAYNLRHGYAIRGHKYGIPVPDMARYMGHDIETHVKEYQRWIGLDTMIDVYLEATSAKQKSRKALLTENAVLTVDNEKLQQKVVELEMQIRLIGELQCK